jgi:hypothetical protein
LSSHQQGEDWTPPKTWPSRVCFDSLTRNEAEAIRCAASLDFSMSTSV